MMNNLEKFTKQADDIAKWIANNAPETAQFQKHLDAGTEARLYWHLGRMTTLRDVVRALSK